MLELRNVSCVVQDNDKNKEILKNINLTLPDNKFIVVTGPNGGGKSTLARVISGIQKNNISVVLQHDIKKYSVEAVEDIITWGLANGYTFLPMTENSKMVHFRPNN